MDIYNSPIGKLLLTCDDTGLTGIFDDAEKYTQEYKLSDDNIDIFDITKKWLDIYFFGKNPDFVPPIYLIGTDFRIKVWKILQDIEFGSLVTYRDIAKRIALDMGREKMSAQTIDGAVGHNNIPIIIPCHRVVGIGGNLTGYTGEMDKKLNCLR